MRPTVATAPGSASASSCAASTARAAGTSASRRPAIAAVPAWSETPRTRAAPALARRERRRDGQRRGHVDEVAPLLDVHLDPRGHARQEGGRGAHARGRHSAQRSQVAQHVALGIRAREHLVHRQLAAQRARAEDRRAEARALLVDHRATASGRAAPPARRAASTATSPPTTPSAPSNAPPSATESTCEPTASNGPSAPPGSIAQRLPAGSCVDLETERGGGRAEPLARGVLPRPPGHAVPAPGLVPDGRQLREETAVEVCVDHVTTGSSVAPVSCTGPSGPIR